jgi:hypothetical protein
MIQCSSCGKQIEKVPSWLQGTKVDFVCNNCPNRQAKNIAFVTLDPEPKAVRADDEEEVEIDEIVDEEEI